MTYSFGGNSTLSASFVAQSVGGWKYSILTSTTPTGTGSTHFRETSALSLTGFPKLKRQNTVSMSCIDAARSVATRRLHGVMEKRRRLNRVGRVVTSLPLVPMHLFTPLEDHTSNVADRSCQIKSRKSRPSKELACGALLRASADEIRFRCGHSEYTNNGSAIVYRNEAIQV